MKKNILKTFAGIVLVFCISFCFTSCSDDIEGCGLTVVVREANSNGRVANAVVEVKTKNGDITRSAVSDNNGEAYFFFGNEAICDIKATYGVAPYTQEGTAAATLKYNEIVDQTVLITGI